MVMVSENFNKAIGFIAGIFTTFAATPQIIYMIKSRQGGDLSYGMILMTLTGVFMWMVYGIINNLLPLVVWNAFAATMFTTMLFLKRFYCKNNKDKHHKNLEK